MIFFLIKKANRNNNTKKKTKNKNKQTKKQNKAKKKTIEIKCINSFCTEYIADMHFLRTNHNHQPYWKYNLNGLNLLQVVFSIFLILEFDLCSLGNSWILLKIYL